MENFVHCQTNNKAILNSQEFGIYEFNRLKIWFAETFPGDDFVNVVSYSNLAIIYRRRNGSNRQLIHFNWYGEGNMNEFHLCEENEVDYDSSCNKAYDDSNDEILDELEIQFGYDQSDDEE